MPDNPTADQQTHTETDDAGTDPTGTEGDTDGSATSDANGTGETTVSVASGNTATEDKPVLNTGDAASPLTIELPDGSKSVSEAIVSHRQMLRNPTESGLATVDAVEELEESVESLTAELTAGREQQAKLDGSIQELRTELDRQHRQIEELKQVTESLADILGATTDWQTFENGDDSDTTGK